MNKRLRTALGGITAIVICVPAGFGIAQATGGDESRLESRHEGSNRATNPIEGLNKAHNAGNAAVDAKALDDLHEQILSRLSQTDREVAESAPPETAVPPGTKTYIPPSMPEALVDSCRDELVKGSESQLCQLIVLHAEGKIRSGTFTAEQQHAALSGEM